MLRTLTARICVCTAAILLLPICFAGEPNGGTEKTTQSAADPAGPRTWADATGQFHTLARLLGIDAGEVCLVKDDGALIKVPFRQLSQADRDFVLATVKTAQSVTDVSKPRAWTDQTNRRVSLGTFVAVADGKVRLKRIDGVEIEVPLEQLADADRELVRSLNARELRKESDSAKPSLRPPPPEVESKRPSAPSAPMARTEALDSVPFLMGVPVLGLTRLETLQKTSGEACHLGGSGQKSGREVR